MRSVPTIAKAVILAAGLGTRMLPATKAVPKEMLPIVDKPLIQYAVEEATAAGIKDITFVIADGKDAIRDHFAANTRTEAMLRAAGNAPLADAVRSTADIAQFHFFRQEQPLGIANAIASAREHLEGEPFVLIFPDDLLLSETSVVQQIASAYTGGSLIAVHEVAPEDIPQYGIVDPVDGSNPARLRGIIEKPTAADAPSNLGVVGRYVLSANIFDHIDRIAPGKNGELQLTDALARQIEHGELVSSFQYEGERYDTGRPLGLIAANVAAALRRPALRAALRERLDAVLGGGSN
jgi:UTP--glucose-1-phosphate uridylyltransferase